MLLFNHECSDRPTPTRSTPNMNNFMRYPKSFKNFHNLYYYFENFENFEAFYLFFITSNLLQQLLKLLTSFINVLKKLI